MDKTALWEAIKRQNNALENPDHRISLTGHQFAKFYNLVWEVAHAEGAKSGDAGIVDKVEGVLDKFENLIHGKSK